MPAQRPLRWYHFRWQVGVVLALGFAGAWWCFLGRFEHPVGAGPAGPAMPPAAFHQPWATGPFVLVGLGDSMTEGYGASKGHSYFNLLLNNDDTLDPDLAGLDLRHLLPGLTTLNLSESYTVSAEHLRDQVPELQQLQRSRAGTRGIVVLTTGGNDLIHDYGRSAPKDGAMYGCTLAQAQGWGEAFRARLTAILMGVAAQFPGGCEIYLANIYDPTDGVGDVEHAHLGLPAWPDGLKVLALMNEVIAETSRAVPHVHLVDLHALFLGHGIHCTDRGNPHYDAADPHYWYFANLEDPNDRGYDAIRRQFLLAISRQFSIPVGKS